MKPIGSDQANQLLRETGGVPIDIVLREVYNHEQHDRSLFGDRYRSEWGSDGE